METACDVLGVSRATFYRRRRDDAEPRPVDEVEPVRRRSHRALSDEERQEVLDTLHSERFVDMAPAEVAATLLDEGRYLCSWRTMYRVLASSGESRERRNQLVHPEYEKPELLARGPNEVWSWDITKLKGPAKWTYFYLYVVVDIYSRYVVGWMVAERETASLAEHLIVETCGKHGVERGELTLHMDRGSPMTAKSFGQLLADLGVTKSHSRPHVSDDNPFSEALFKTVKYRPGFPKKFEYLEHATAFGREFIDWYNNSHRHSGIAMLTPAQLHYGEGEAVLDRRQAILDVAWREHPERFVNGRPDVGTVPEAVWINPPSEDA